MSDPGKSVEQKAQIEKVSGILLLILGTGCLIFSIVRYNSVVSQFRIASGEGDPQLVVSLTIGIVSTFLGVLLTFIAVEAREIFLKAVLPIGKRLFAVYLISVALLDFRIITGDAAWLPYLSLAAGVLILFGALFTSRNIGMLALGTYSIFLSCIAIFGVSELIIPLALLALTSGIFILIGR